MSDLSILDQINVCSQKKWNKDTQFTVYPERIDADTFHTDVFTVKAKMPDGTCIQRTFFNSTAETAQLRLARVVLANLKFSIVDENKFT